MWPLGVYSMGITSPSRLVEPLEELHTILTRNGLILLVDSR